MTTVARKETTAVARIPEHVYIESKRVAALRGQQPAEVLAAAWKEYLENHRDEFVAELEAAADALRNGTLDDLVDFLNRDADAQAAAAFEAGRAS